MSNDDWDKLTKELNELCKRYGCDFRFANGTLETAPRVPYVVVWGLMFLAGAPTSGM